MLKGIKTSLYLLLVFNLYSYTSSSSIKNLAINSQDISINFLNLYFPNPEYLTQYLSVNPALQKQKYNYLDAQDFLANGIAIFYPEDIDCSLDAMEKLYNSEQLAIDKKIGIWQNEAKESFFDYENCTNICFIIISGKVDKISLYQKSFYINLIENRFKKLAIILPYDYMKKLNIAYKNYRSLIGKEISIRGWYNKKNNRLYPMNHMMVRIK